MQALAVTPAAPSTEVSAPIARLPGSLNQSNAAYKNATVEKHPNSRTSLLSQDRFHIFSARYAWMGRPRWSVEALSASPATSSDTSAATSKRVVFPNNCSSQMVTKAPTESCVSTVIATRGQFGSSGLTRKKSAFRVSGGKLWGRVMRVEEILSSADGRPGALAFTAYSRFHSAMFTISMRMAVSGQALTHAGGRPSPSRSWHMSHFPTTPRSGLYCGTPYEQFHVQYWQPMQVSALCNTTPVTGCLE